MQERPGGRGRGRSVFPKLGKLESSPLEICRVGGLKQMGESIFKKKSEFNQEKAQIERIVVSLNRIEEDVIIKSKEYQELESELADAKRRHQEEMAELEKNISLKDDLIKSLKSQNHSIKLQFWNIKNSILDLNASIQEQQSHQEKLITQIGNRILHT